MDTIMLNYSKSYSYRVCIIILSILATLASSINIRLVLEYSTCILLPISLFFIQTTHDNIPYLVYDSYIYYERTTLASSI